MKDPVEISLTSGFFVPPTAGLRMTVREMRKFLYILVLILATLVQITWAPFLNWRGYSLPLVLLVLLISTLFWNVTEVLIFAFAIGIFFSFLGGGIVGLESLSLILALGAAHLMRSVFLARKSFGFVLSAISAIIVYEGISYFFC